MFNYIDYRFCFQHVISTVWEYGGACKGGAIIIVECFYYGWESNNNSRGGILTAVSIQRLKELETTHSWLACHDRI
jgi:hypothetical protein